jgi:sugar phosphate isomerase/epimerase
MDYGIKHDPMAAGRGDWRDIFTDLARFFAEVRRFGATFIEMPCGEDWDLGLLVDHAKQAARAGLWASVHPYYGDDLAPEIFQAEKAGPGLRRLFEAVQTIGDITGHAVPVVFHGGHANCPPHHVPLDEALARARDYFAWADLTVRQSFPRGQVLCETAFPFPDAEWPRTRLGDNYADCLILVHGSGARTCWDFGHMYFAAHFGRTPWTPPPEFLRRVGHVHCHDVIRSADGLHDHQPPGTGIAPWRENLKLLAGAGFTGGVLFEIDLVGLGGYVQLEGMLRSAIRDSETAFGKAPGGA